MNHTKPNFMKSPNEGKPIDPIQTKRNDVSTEVIKFS